jgi:AGZA family xanthine/uracil permease-like MFS transporter
MTTLDRFFRVSERKSTMRREVLGGATTFVTMAYIIVVNPAVLAFAGIPVGPSTVATILTAVFGTLLMALVAKRPIAVAPYMGENAFIAFGLAALAITWQQRLAAVLLSGVAFLLTTIMGIRQWLAAAISASMKHAFVVGIGLFLAIIGLYESGIVSSFVTGVPSESLLVPGQNVLRAPDVPLKIGDLRDPRVLLAIGCFFATITLLVYRVRGAILIGIATTAALGMLLGYAPPPSGVFTLPIGGDYDLSLIAFQLDFRGLLEISMIPVLLTLFLMGFLDTLGTLVGLGAAGEMLDHDGNFPEIERPMLVDAITCVFAPLVGTSTSGAYIESATGIREGARTGLASVVTALLFAVSAFFLPLIDPLQSLRFAYAPALVVVGVLMLGAVRRIEFDDLTELAPAVVTITMIVFTYNIANGLTAGLLVWPLLKAAAGRLREVSPGALALALLSAVYYAFGLPH